MRDFSFLSFKKRNKIINQNSKPMENRRFKQERDAEKAVSLCLIMIIIIVFGQIVVNYIK